MAVLTGLEPATSGLTSRHSKPTELQDQNRTTCSRYTNTPQNDVHVTVSPAPVPTLSNWVAESNRSFVWRPMWDLNPRSSP